ncbi:hypothetical protein GCM10023189_45420 [Nibrella saemangeumensis]|uniref:Copper oxidase n=1 Tax=Nibrella saemangeumensis TaxID=1084526 RepID=A0ABP8NFY2_9BACT
MEYDLVIDEKQVNITGKPTKGMVINGTIPGPTLTFTEGDIAVIRVHNKMNVETSLHWHGILLPNQMDGVSYLNTPPIEAGKSLTFEFPLVQSGTYWFHSHTRYQEQIGVYGSLVIKPQQSTVKVDHELVLVLSDWTDENPSYILKNLKRRRDWYAIKKGNMQSLNRIIAHKAVGAYLRQSMMRMPPMDISDVYYPRFLINGKDTSYHQNFTAGETIRLRVINASASTYFHLNYAGGTMKLIATDGVDVQPIEVDRRLIAIAETYDFLITIPKGGAFEVRASAQDGTGYASSFLGKGPKQYAPTIPRPDLFALTKSMSSMTHQGMGHQMGQMDMNHSDTTSTGAGQMNTEMDHSGHTMGTQKARQTGTKAQKADPKKSATSKDMSTMDHASMGHTSPQPERKQPNQPSKSAQGTATPAVDHSAHTMSPTTGRANDKTTPAAGHQGHTMDKNALPKNNKKNPKEKADPTGMAKTPHQMGQNNPGADGTNGMGSMMDPLNTIDYSVLRSPEPIRFPADRPVREIPLTLTGNMYRYIWGINGQPLSRADKIMIRRGEITRIRMINNTMMLHPFHLHGHYFRVLNGQGEYSPLKHTVNVSPMESVTIEFLADDEKDWFFHCHLLYHMMTGMARVVSYGDPLDPSIASIQKLHMRDMRDNQIFAWGFAQPGYPSNYWNLTFTNNKNAFIIEGDADWKGNFELDADYERYLGDWFRVFAGVDAGNELFLRRSRTSDEAGLDPGGRRIIRAVAGIRYVLPFMIESEVKVDARGNVRLQLEGQQALFPRLALDYTAQWLIGGYTRLHAGLQYTITKNLHIHADYDSRYMGATGRFGGGLGYSF